ncbi:MAG: ATP-binding protein [Treponemataceae bacterium]|nr:ATP-binding protein [Treponemataceae bacterium]
MTISYLALFMVMGGISIYAIFKLHQINKVTRSSLRINAPILEQKANLVDAILSQLRFKKKYLLTRDPLFFQQYLSAQGDFDQRFPLLSTVADTDEKRASLKQIASHYRQFKALVDQEIQYVRQNRTYPVRQFENEIERAVDGILEGLGQMEAYARMDIHGRMKMLVDFTSSAQPWVIGLSLFFLLVALALSVFITRSITRPLAQLIHKTEEISKGIYDCHLNITSPPELMELAKAFDAMCAKLNALDQMKSDFFSSISHELRTPLTSIKEGIGLLQKSLAEKGSPQQIKILKILSEESRRLIDLTNAVLDLSKMEAGMMTYTFRSTDLSPLIHQAVAELTPLREAKQIQLGLELDPTVPKLNLDRERILQVLRNLIGNAIKFTPQGGEILVKMFKGDEGVRVSVEDTGPGIPEEKLEAIFEKYHQGPDTKDSRMKGTGLGLAMVKHIINAHGGRVWAENRSGKGGSLFTFLLPLSFSS